MKHTMVPLINSYQEYKNHKFNNLTKSFKKEHPWIKIRPPRMLCDRQPPPYLNKTNWMEKTKKNILRIDVQYPQKEEIGHYICWKNDKRN